MSILNRIFSGFQEKYVGETRQLIELQWSLKEGVNLEI